MTNNTDTKRNDADTAPSTTPPPAAAADAPAAAQATPPPAAAEPEQTAPAEDAPAPAAPASSPLAPETPAQEGGEAPLSAAEREYQEVMHTARSLGLSASPDKAPTDQKVDEAKQLLQKWGLDKPLPPTEPPLPSDIFPAPPAPAEKEPEEEAEDELLGPEMGDGRAWYVINTYAGHENRVKVNLERRISSMDVAERIFRVVVPTEEELEIRGGQRRRVQRKLLPGYVLAEMILDDDTWYVVRNTPGVTGFVGTDQPHPLQREEVKTILRQMRVVEPRIRVGFEIGDTIRIREGPFQDFMGEVDEINLDKGKVRVLISMFGRDTPVELDFTQAEKP